MHKQQLLGWALVSLISTTLVLPAYAQYYDAPDSRLQRKFANKPNHIKKQGYYAGPDVPGIEKVDLGYGPASGPGAIGPPQESGINWGKTMNMVMQFVMGAAQAFTSGTQIEKVDNGEAGSFSWAKVISIGMQVILNMLGGGSETQLEKNDNPTRNAVQGVLATVLGLAMGQDDPQSVQVMAKQATQLFGLVMDLTEVLKTSFSERSLQARSLGEADYTADAGLTVMTMLQPVASQALLGDDTCGLKSMCMSSKECMDKTKDDGMFCTIGSYIAAYSMSSSQDMYVIEEAARYGREGQNCEALYECNSI